jgi:hypothetical protein
MSHTEICLLWTMSKTARIAYTSASLVDFIEEIKTALWGATV